MKKYIPTIGKERERLSGSLEIVTRDLVIAEARDLELDDPVFSRIKYVFSPDFINDDDEPLSDEEWGVPISSQGRLSYNLQLVPCRLRANRLGSVRKDGYAQRDDYKGEHIEINEGNVYLLQETLLPVTLGDVVLDISQKEKGLKQGKFDRLVRKTEKVINSLLQNPSCRSKLASYEGMTAIDLFLVFDLQTPKLDPNFNGYNVGSVNGVGYSSSRYLQSGELGEILRSAEAGTIHLVKEKLGC